MCAEMIDKTQLNMKENGRFAGFFRVLLRFIFIIPLMIGLGC